MTCALSHSHMNLRPHALHPSTYAKYYFQLRSMRPVLQKSEEFDTQKPFDLEDARKLEATEDKPGITGVGVGAPRPRGSSDFAAAEATATEGGGTGGGFANYTRPRRRSNTMGGGEPREVIEKHIKHGYQFSDKAPAAASVEQVVKF